MNAAADAWPALPPAEWHETCETLHLWTQIVGKTRLAFAPMQNHWWQTTLYLTPRGLTTSAIPHGARSFAVDFDFIDHRLTIQSSDGASQGFALEPIAVADFFARYLVALRSLGIEPKLLAAALHPADDASAPPLGAPRGGFVASPSEVAVAIPFAADRTHASYVPAAAQRCWQILAQSERVLQRFRSRFVGKQSPVHFFWGSFDLAATRFSGRPAPRHPGGAPNCPDYVMVEAYSHECSSCGFWPGDGAAVEPAFYAYAYPEPPGYAAHPVQPAAAHYDAALHEFILPYQALRGEADPDATLLAFVQSTYDAAADLGRWDRAALDRARRESR